MKKRESEFGEKIGFIQNHYHISMTFSRQLSHCSVAVEGINWDAHFLSLGKSVSSCAIACLICVLGVFNVMIMMRWKWKKKCMMELQRKGKIYFPFIKLLPTSLDALWDCFRHVPEVLPVLLCSQSLFHCENDKFKQFS